MTLTLEIELTHHHLVMLKENNDLQAAISAAHSGWSKTQYTNLTNQSEFIKWSLLQMKINDAVITALKTKGAL